MNPLRYTPPKRTKKMIMDHWDQNGMPIKDPTPAPPRNIGLDPVSDASIPFMCTGVAWQSFWLGCATTQRF
jgi:hypothetical protein